jgi:hypothetical protein
MDKLASILLDFARFIFFKPPRSNVGADWRIYLAVGLVITWIVGVGRSWDDPEATIFDLSGIGSILYVFGLGLVIWLIGAPLRPERWTYRNVVLMVTMTALPGLIYAFPIERFVAAADARTVNMSFLAIVATWRMALFAAFLVRVAKLPPASAAVVTFLPPVLIIAPISAFGFLGAVLSGMGGVRDAAQQAQNDLIVFAAMTSWTLLPILLIAWGVLIGRRRPG